MMLDLLFSFRQDEDEQTFDENEAQSFIPFEIKINFQKQLLEQYISNPTYKNNQDLLLISLYRWLPERDELKALKFTTINKSDDHYTYITNDEVYLSLNKDKKRHGKLHLNLSKKFPGIS